MSGKVNCYDHVSELRELTEKQEFAIEILATFTAIAMIGCNSGACQLNNKAARLWPKIQDNKIAINACNDVIEKINKIDLNNDK